MTTTLEPDQLARLPGTLRTLTGFTPRLDDLLDSADAHGIAASEQARLISPTESDYIAGTVGYLTGFFAGQDFATSAPVDSAAFRAEVWAFMQERFPDASKLFDLTPGGDRLLWEGLLGAGADDQSWRGKVPACFVCHQRPMYLGGKCGDCYAAELHTPQDER